MISKFGSFGVTTEPAKEAPKTPSLTPEQLTAQAAGVGSAVGAGLTGAANLVGAFSQLADSLRKPGPVAGAAPAQVVAPPAQTNPPAPMTAGGGRRRGGGSWFTLTNAVYAAGMASVLGLGVYFARKKKWI